MTSEYIMIGIATIQVNLLSIKLVSVNFANIK